MTGSRARRLDIKVHLYYPERKSYKTNPHTIYIGFQKKASMNLPPPPPAKFTLANVKIHFSIL